jgi:hypothetical protein
LDQILHSFLTLIETGCSPPDDVGLDGGPGTAAGEVVEKGIALLAFQDRLATGPAGAPAIRGRDLALTRGGSCSDE